MKARDIMTAQPREPSHDDDDTRLPMKRFSAYATTFLTAGMLVLAGCSGHNNNDENAQPGAATPAAPATTPATTPPPPVAPSPSSTAMPPASHTSPTPAPASTAAH